MRELCHVEASANLGSRGDNQIRNQIQENGRLSGMTIFVFIFVFVLVFVFTVSPVILMHSKGLPWKTFVLLF